MVITMQTALEYTQKEMRNKFKHFTAKNSTKCKRRQEYSKSIEKAIRHMENKYKTYGK